MQVLFFSSFLALNLPTATENNQKYFWLSKAKIIASMLPKNLYYKAIESYPILSEPDRPVRFTIYTPQIPAAILLGYVLGFPVAALAACLYLLVGLLGTNFGINIFAAGGGLNYYAEPSFGYLIGMVVAATIVGRITETERSSLRQLAAVLFGVPIVHLVGLIYMLGACIVCTLLDNAHLSIGWQPWISQQIRNLTWYQLPYDFFFSFACISLAFPIRWLVKTLTSSDTAPVFKQERTTKAV
jgi:biotin transport system substrate-specific component